jgi:MOSC domain-containing protein YiiM
LQAILLIASEGIEELTAQGYGVYPGALGENFTTSGLDRREIRFGDRYRAGQAVIEITRMRTPCSTLDIFNEPGLPRIQDVIFDEQVEAGGAGSPRWGLSGFYARVVNDGLVRSGDRITFLDTLA